MSDLFRQLDSFIENKNDGINNKFSDIKYGVIKNRPTLYINNIQLLLDYDNLLLCKYRDSNMKLFNTDVDIVAIVRDYFSLDSNCDTDILTWSDKLVDDEDLMSNDAEELDEWSERVMNKVIIPIRNYIALGAVCSRLINPSDVEDFCDSVICNLFIIKIIEDVSRNSDKWKFSTINIDEELIEKMKRNIIGALETTPTLLNAKDLLDLI